MIGNQAYVFQLQNADQEISGFRPLTTTEIRRFIEYGEHSKKH